MLAAVIAVALVGCTNEREPATWVKRLDDPARRVEAIERLEHMRAEAGDAGEAAKKIDEVIAEPLTRTYVAGGLDAKAADTLIITLASMRDARTLPALLLALARCDEPTSATRVASAAIAVTALARSNVSLDSKTHTAVATCFSQRAPSARSTDADRALRYALVALKEPKPLVTVLMTRSKAASARDARDALAMMPRAAEPVLAAALDGADPDFVALRSGWSADAEYIPVIVDALAMLGLDSARDAVLAAIPSIGNAKNAAAVAQSLEWFPPSPRTIDAYRAIYSRLPPIEEHGDHDTGYERAALLQSASELLDPNLAAWALAESANASGEHMPGAKVGAIQSALKLMQPKDKAAVLAAVDALENRSRMSKLEKHEIADNLETMVSASMKALDQCGISVGCYLGVLDEPIGPLPNENWKAIKAAYMCGALGNDETRKGLVGRASAVKNPGVRYAIALAIQHLAPAGDAADADALEQIVERDEMLDAIAKTHVHNDEDLARAARLLRARAQ